MSEVLVGPYREFRMNLDRGFVQTERLSTILEYGYPELEVLHVMNRVLRLGDVAVDGGAAVGFFTLWMAQLVGLEGMIIAYEPDARNLEHLRANCALNKYDWVQIHNTALWSKIECRDFYEAADSGSSSLVYAEHPVNVRRVTTGLIDREDIRLIKLDIEGAEEAVLSSLSAFVPYIIVEMNADMLARFNRTSESLRDMMRGKGYDMFVINTYGTLPVLVPPKTKFTPVAQNTNVLFSTISAVGEVWTSVEA